MKQFTDSTGRAWQLTLTVGAIKRVKGLLGADLLALHEGDPPLAARLATDVVLVCDVLYAILKPDLDQAGISDEAFGQRLAGAAIAAAYEALCEELCDFFRSLGRTELVKVIQTQRAVVRQVVEAAERRIDGLPIEALIAQTLGTPSTSSPALPALIPTPSP
jgi:hypothetical protein